MSYCNSCNKTLPDGTNVCPSCGAYVPQTEEKKEETAKVIPEDGMTVIMEPDEPEEELPKPKKKFNWGSILVWVLIVAVGIAINTWRSSRPTVEVSDSDDPSAEYLKVFEDAGITPEDNYKDSDVDHVAYAFLDTDGCVYQEEYGFKGDKIVSFVETAYLPLDGFSENDKKLLDSNIREGYADVEALSFATVTYGFEGDYYKVNVKFVDFDKWENIKAAAATEMYEDDVSGEEFYYSVKETEQNFLNDGYFKK